MKIKQGAWTSLFLGAIV